MQYKQHTFMMLSTCRQLYRVLKHLEPLIGIWKCPSASAKPALYIFSWGPGCISSRKLSYDVPGQDPFVDPFHQVGPGHSTTVQHLDEAHCLLTVQVESARSLVPKAVQAATAVAVGGIAIPKRVCHASHMLSKAESMVGQYAVQSYDCLGALRCCCPLVTC